MTIDASNNLYVTGLFVSSSVTFGTSTLTNSISGNGDIFLVKFDTAGNVLWANNSTGTASDDEATGITVDNTGNVYVIDISIVQLLFLVLRHLQIQARIQ